MSEPRFVDPPVPEDDSRAHRTVDEPEPGRRPTSGQVSATQRIVTGRGGARVPVLGLGTSQLEGTTATSVVTEALELGYRHIDTAQSYGNETEIGAALAESSVDRADVFVTTKVANDRHEPAPLVSSVSESLQRLGTEYVDLLLVHWPVDPDRLHATLDAAAQVHASGAARHIGVSNFTVDLLERFAGFAPLEVLQVECHPFLAQRELHRWCVEHGWVFTAYSPLAQGRALEDDTVQEIARRHDASPAAVCLAWLLAREGVAAIPRSADPAHLADNRTALELELTDDDLGRLDGLDRGLRIVDPDDAPWAR